MARQQVSDKKERSLGEIIIIVLIVSVLMMSFIHYFFKQEEQLTNVGFNALLHNFSIKVTTVRAQWFMDKQPNIVSLISSEKIQQIYVNDNGWIDTQSSTLACEVIWRVVMGEQTNFMNIPITAQEVLNIEVNNKIISPFKVCKYSLPSKESFEYNTANGKVNRVFI